MPGACRRNNHRGALALALLTALALPGCARPVSVKRVDPSVVHEDLTANVLTSGKPSAAASQFLTRADLRQRYQQFPGPTLAQIHSEIPEHGGEDRLYALSELSFQHALKGGGAEWFRASAIYAYAFLFPEEGPRPDALDPRVRVAANLYNRGLTKGLAAEDGLRVDLSTRSLPLPFGVLDLLSSPEEFEWAGMRLAEFVPAADYEVRGLRNRYRLPGIGAPLSANVVPAAPNAPRPPEARHIAPRTKAPVTAFVRMSRLRAALAGGRVLGELELYSAEEWDGLEVGDEKVPLEAEWTSSLAYMLENSRLWDFEWRGFFIGDFRPDEAANEGLMFLQPHQPGRVPVVLVHGTASSPARWVEMVNELVADPELRRRIEFWPFIYNTGNPIAYSAAMLRNDLRNAVAEIDPEGRDPKLQEMVVIGHSQGGLLTRMQVTDSGDDFWTLITDVPFDQIELDDDSRVILEASLFFEPLPFVKRVVFIATPHRGSFLASYRLSALVKRFTRAPARLAGVIPDLLTRNPGLRAEHGFERLPSSLDNMDPRNDFILTLSAKPIAPGVSAHSIIAVKGTGPLESRGDGVVLYESAHLEGVESELVIQSGHSVQGHPRAISEVARILREHLEMD